MSDRGDATHAGRLPADEQSADRGAQQSRRAEMRRRSTDDRRQARLPGRQRPQISDDRYRRGARRTDAEPLRASWQPDLHGQARHPGASGARRGARRTTSRLSQALRAYGWRTYALPVLLVLSVIVVMDVRGGAGEDPDESALGIAGHERSIAPRDEAPVATENPAVPADLDVPTAELPAGGDYTKEGEGTWTVLSGTGKKVGDGGRLFRYTVEVEDGIDAASFGGSDAFASVVDATLADPRSWIGGGEVSFQRIDDPDKADFRLSLTTPATNRDPEVCGYTIQYEASCYRRDIDRVVINVARWVRGAMAFNSDLGAYRQYVINHEVGHVLGNGHVGCQEQDALAPVMMQQSFGVANDYVAKLNNAGSINNSAVPSDGKVCKPNAWPNPQAG